MRTRLGLQVLKDTKHLSVRTRRALYYVAMVCYISSVCGRLVGANFLSILLNPGPTVALLLCSCEVYNEPELRYLGFQRARVL